ncbi:MAG: hypothetical protein ACT4ON_04495 [Bacteroidota bacterium]
MEKKIKVIGICSLILGSIAALLCIVPVPAGVFFAVLVGFLGTICSSIYIFIDTRYEINTKKITPGVIGLLLSSIPIVLILTVIILSKINQ